MAMKTATAIEPHRRACLAVVEVEMIPIALSELHGGQGVHTGSLGTGVHATPRIKWKRSITDRRYGAINRCGTLGANAKGFTEYVRVKKPISRSDTDTY